MFRKDIDLNNRQEMIDFLTNHFRYYTMNSWNRMTSYAQNVKLRNLNIPQELHDKAYDFIFCDSTEDYDWDERKLIEEFTVETGYSARFNGRSCGYIVLYDTDINEHLERYVCSHGVDEYEDFREWKTEDLIKRVTLVQRFDKLCDDIRELFLYYVEHCEIKEVEVVHKETKRTATLAGG